MSLSCWELRISSVEDGGAESVREAVVYEGKFTLMSFYILITNEIQVLQEVAAAKKVVVVCGGQVVAGNDFYLEATRVAFVHKSLQKPLRKIQPAIELMNQSSTTFQRQSLPLVELIEAFRSWDATKTVNKVYSLLAFSSDSYNEPELRPDYTISADVLAQNIMKFTYPKSEIIQSTETKLNLVTF